MATTASRKPSQEPSLRSFSRSLPMALLRVREAVMANFRPVLREYALTEQQWRVLRALTAARTPQRLVTLAEATFLSEPSLSRLVKTLEARDIVSRKSSTDDLRATQLSLTRGGRALVAKIAPRSEAAYAAIAARLGHDELELLYAVLERARARLAPDDAV